MFKEVSQAESNWDLEVHKGKKIRNGNKFVGKYKIS
jgi:hypothetical protein